MAVVALVNGFRASHGRAPLITQAMLGQAAELHAQDQAAHDFSGHTGSNGSTLQQRLAAAGYAAQVWGENVAWHTTDGSAQMAFTLWRDSPPHHDAMLDSRYQEIGVGRAQSASGVWYWTADFARPQ